MPVAIVGTLVLALTLTAHGAAAPAEPLQGVLEPYLRIQAQLAEDRADGVAKEAVAVADAAERVGPEARPISSAARELAATRTLEAARKAFGNLSTALIAYAEKTNASLGPDIHAVHCPMAGAGATWLQKGEAIRNPHFGKSMLTCGEIKKRPGA